MLIYLRHTRVYIEGRITVRYSHSGVQVFFLEDCYIGLFQNDNFYPCLLQNDYKSRILSSTRLPLEDFSPSFPRGAVAGTIRFIGVTQFAEGTWLGVELDEAKGKNNGTVLHGK